MNRSILASSAALAGALMALGTAGCGKDAGGSGAATGGGVTVPAMGTGDCSMLPVATGVQTACLRTGNDSPNVWVRCGGGVASDEAYAVAVAPDGSIYVGGSFGQLIDPNGLQTIADCLNMTQADFERASFAMTEVITSGGGEDLFLAKYSSAGQLLWIRTAPGPADDGAVRGLAISPADSSVVAVGDFAGQAMFGSFPVATQAHRDVFVAKYSPNGDVIWVDTATVAPDPFGNDDATAHGVTIDPLDETIVVTGHYAGTISFPHTDPSLPPVVLTALGPQDLFVAEFSQTGDIVWADEAGGTEDISEGRDATTEPDGTFMVVGTLAGGAVEHITDFYGTDVMIASYSGTGMAENQSDMLLIHYSHDGRVLWATNAGYPGEDTLGEGVTHDSLGNVYVVGRFGECLMLRKQAVLPLAPPLPFVPPPPGTCVDTPGESALMGSGNHDWFVAKYAESGLLLWAKAFGDFDLDRGYAIDMYEGPAGSWLYVGGRFRENVDFGGPLGLVTCQGIDCHGIIKMDTEGNVLWAKSLDGDAESAFFDLAVDPRDGAVVGAGAFNGVVSFEASTPNEATLTACTQFDTDTLATDGDVVLYRLAP
ncbi:MAG: SBBP repeat-containing protein [Proteobacteria bacterium]|nr:SBBP repeat-containing protein [Pseudomonadota bacterium]